MSETSVGADLLEALEVLTELAVDTVGQDLEVLAVDNVALPVEEPGGDLVLGGVLDDGDDTLKLFRGKLTGAVREEKYTLESGFMFHLDPSAFAAAAASSAASASFSSSSSRLLWAKEDG